VQTIGNAAQLGVCGTNVVRQRLIHVERAFQLWEQAAQIAGF
jgi:hypothetical protein